MCRCAIKKAEISNIEGLLVLCLFSQKSSLELRKIVKIKVLKKYIISLINSYWLPISYQILCQLQGYKDE